MDNVISSAPTPSSSLEQTIVNALKGIRYGSLEIIIHDSRIVQIERKEKVRFDIEGNGKR